MLFNGIHSSEACCMPCSMYGFAGRRGSQAGVGFIARDGIVRIQGWVMRARLGERHRIQPCFVSVAAAGLFPGFAYCPTHSCLLWRGHSTDFSQVLKVRKVLPSLS